MLQKNPANQGRKFQLCVLLHSRNQVGIMTSTWFFKTQRHTDTVHWISDSSFSISVKTSGQSCNRQNNWISFFSFFLSLWPVPSTIPQFFIIVITVDLYSFYFGTNIKSERPIILWPIPFLTLHQLWELWVKSLLCISLERVALWSTKPVRALKVLWISNFYYSAKK